KGRFRADQITVLRFIGAWKDGSDDKYFSCLGDFQDPEVRGPLERRIKKLAKGQVDPLGPARTYMELDEQTRSLVDCPSCFERGTLTEPRQFNLMFETFIGALRDDSSKAYLRPETAQGIFANFRNVVDTTRIKLPFGIAQVGKSFRNEINP